jgi:hypothetical protein
VDAPTLNVRMDEPEPGAGIGLALNAAAVPEGSPDADSETGDENPVPAVVVTVVAPVPPWAALTDVGDTFIAKSGAELTPRVTVVVCVMPPPVAVMVIG